MLAEKTIDQMKSEGREIIPAKTGDDELGPFALLPGEWRSLPGRGWNMIALPFEGGQFKYRLLMNQYNETLKFTLVDKGVPNRGLAFGGDPAEADQLVVAMDYEQTIEQIDAEDSPKTDLAGGPGLPIHHEPGLLLHMANHAIDKLDIARLATIPHGDSVLALGRWHQFDGPPEIPVISGLPIGVDGDVETNPCLEPYKDFTSPLFNNLFDPRSPNDLLTAANTGLAIARTTELSFDSTLETGGISNIPFVVRQANAAEMTSTFWIQELEELDENGAPKLRLQYTQTVMLDFFERRDGVPGLIRWPHVSINTMEKMREVPLARVGAA